MAHFIHHEAGVPPERIQQRAKRPAEGVRCELVRQWRQTFGFEPLVCLSDRSLACDILAVDDTRRLAEHAGAHVVLTLSPAPRSGEHVVGLAGILVASAHREQLVA